MNCAIYCRISREDDCPRGDVSESIQNQRDMLTGYAHAREWDIFAIYCDEDYSGMDRSRPAWRKMLAAAELGEFSLLLCKTQSRFTRDMELVEHYLHTMFPLWGIRFVTLVDNADTEVRGNKKARQINGLINEWYLEDLSENIRAVFDQKRRAGRFIGSGAVYGYKRDPDDHGHLVIDAAAENVRKIFSLYLEGVGVRRIAAMLNQNGVLSPTAYKAAKAGTVSADVVSSSGWMASGIVKIDKMVSGETSNGGAANGGDANGGDANGGDANGRDANGGDANGRDANGETVCGTSAQSATAPLWSHTAVSRILRCETYIGSMVQGTKRRVSYKSKKLVSVPRDQWICVEATHEAIIDRDTFERVQKRLGLHTRSDGSGIAHPLGGRVFCADCGAPLVKSSCCYNGSSRSYLRCKRYASVAVPPCTPHSIRLDRLIDCVSERIASLLDAAGVARVLGGGGNDSNFEVARVHGGGGEGEDGNFKVARVSKGGGGFGGFAPAPGAAPAGAASGRKQRELSELRRKAARTSRGIAALYLDRSDGVITPEQFVELARELTEEHKSLKQQILLLEAALEPKLDESDPQNPTASSLLDPGENLTALVSLLIDRIEVCEPQSKTSREIRIHWNI